MAHQMTKLSMNWHEEFRPGELNQFRKFILVGVARNVNRRDAVIEHLGAAPIQVVDKLVNCALITRNEARRQHHRISRVHSHPRMSLSSKLHHCGKRLTLASTGHERQLMRIEKLGLTRADQR